MLNQPMFQNEQFYVEMGIFSHNSIWKGNTQMFKISARHYISTNSEKCMKLFLILLLCPLLSLSQIQKQLQWTELPHLPGNQPVYGMYFGTIGEALLCMGGADFPPEQLISNSKVSYFDHIYILRKGSKNWDTAKAVLPKLMGFGVAISYNNKIILVGGRNAKGYLSDVFTIELNNGQIKFDKCPSLPFPLAYMSGSIVRNTLFIAGGKRDMNDPPSNSFLALNLLSSRKELGWVKLDSLPGPGRIFSTCASTHDKFFLFGGMKELENSHIGNKFNYLNDAYKFIPEYENGEFAGGKWVSIPNSPKTIVAGCQQAATIGSDHLLFPCKIENTNINDNPANNKMDSILHILAFNVKANVWLDFGTVPIESNTTNLYAVQWGNEYVIIDPQTSPKNEMHVLSIARKLAFGWLNWMALIIYLIFMLWLGIFYDKKGQTTSNFFTANGKIPWWASGFSIYGSQLSAITFMAVPAIVFATDWSLAIGSVLILITVPIVSKYYVPFFRRLSVISAYEYLEHRFSRSVRLLGCISFILFQLGRMGIVLFLPATAIAAVTGINIYLIIAIMGIICIIYTVMGGIEAVVWTDVSQVIILMGGAILCLFIAIAKIDGGLQSVISLGLEVHKFTLFHLGWSAKELTLWVCIVGFFFLNIIPYTSDQTVIQKYLIVKDEKETIKSLWFNAIITMPATLIFFGLGTVLFVFYMVNPAIIPSDKVGDVLPYFIVQQLPVGVAGLVIAGIFAASQSTLSSSMNSVAATYYSDIYQPFRNEMNDHNNHNTLYVARIVTVIAGVFGTGSALVIAFMNVEFIFNLFSEVLGILGGSLAGAFILGIFTRKSNSFGVICGIILGALMALIVRYYTDISVYLYGAISVMGCVVIGYFISLIVPSSKDAEGFTFSTINSLKDKTKQN